MFTHITDSKEAKEFFKSCGIVMNKSFHNTITLKDKNTGNELELWAQSDSGVCAGIPGIFIDVKDLIEDKQK